MIDILRWYLLIRSAGGCRCLIDTTSGPIPDLCVIEIEQSELIPQLSPYLNHTNCEVEAVIAQIKETKTNHFHAVPLFNKEFNFADKMGITNMIQGKHPNATVGF